MQDHKIIENLLSPGWLHSVQASLSYQDLER